MRRATRLLDFALHHGSRLPSLLQRTFKKVLEHDDLNLSQSAAYSAIIALFPALILIAATIALLPDVAPLKVEISEFFDEVLPPNALDLLTSYFVSAPGASQVHTVRSLFLAAVVSISGGSSVIATLMEGVRRAQDLPKDCWTAWERRKRALLLVPLSLLPLVLATMLVVFGRLMTDWAAAYLTSGLRPFFYALTLAVRWSVSLAGVVGLTASIYHFGLPVRQRRIRSLPGAIVATALWFISTLIFGWYVTRFANYNQVYGSLGAGIALLFWLYIVFLSVLCGAEFNAQFFATGWNARTEQQTGARTVRMSFED